MTEDRARAVPALAICGHSGSGKTTLIEALIPTLRAWGWRVAVLKRTHHAVDIDVAGKDSERFFRAGASVALQARGQAFVRIATPTGEDRSWTRALRRLGTGHDLVLVEGHKEVPLPKLWLLGPGEHAPPAGVTGVLATLGREQPRVSPALALCQRRMAQVLATRPLLGALVVDHGHDRASVAEAVAELARHVGRVVLVGDHDGPTLPRLAPVPGVKPPALAHTLAALRWAPDATWLVARPGPGLTAAALTELLARRRPGCWIVNGPAGSEVTLYEPQARDELEDAADDAPVARWVPVARSAVVVD